MSDPAGGGPLKPQDAVMYALGELKGQMTAVVAGQQSQADVNAENKREHEEFRKNFASHDAALAVLNDNKQAAVGGRAEFWTRIGIWVAIVGVVATVVLTIIWH